MGQNKINYEKDTITSVVEEVLPVDSIITTNKVKIDTSPLHKTDTTYINTKGVQDSLKSVNKVSPITTKSISITKKDFSIKLRQEDTNSSPRDSIPTKNFLETIADHNYLSKPGKVFLDVGTKEQYHKVENLDFKKVESIFDWVLPILLVSMGIIIWLKNTYIRYIELLFNSVISYHISVKLYKDPSSRYSHLSYILNFNAVLTVGLFLHQLVNYYDISFISDVEIFSYFFIVLILLIIYVLQYLGYSILGKIIEGQTELHEYLHHTYALSKILGIFLIPIIIINTYTTDIVIPYFLFLGLIILLLFYLKRIQRGIRILMQKQFLKFQQILYFCTLEILPVLVISKFVSSLIERSF